MYCNWIINLTKKIIFFNSYNFKFINKKKYNNNDIDSYIIKII